MRSTLTPPHSTDEFTGFIGSHVVIEGNLTFTGTLKFSGRLKGKISTPDTLITTPEAIIEGEIDAGVAMLSGKINAEVKTSKRVELCSPAHFRGNILTPSLKVQEGVIFEGSTKMLNPY